MEKYLTIEVLNKVLRVYAFKNDKKGNSQAPDFKGNGVAVWVNEREEKPKPIMVPESEVVL